MPHIMSIVYPHSVEGLKPRMRTSHNYCVLEKTDVAIKDISEGNNIKLVAEISKNIKGKYTVNIEEKLGEGKTNDVFSYYCDNDNNFYFTTPDMTLENVENFLDNARVNASGNVELYLSSLNQKTNMRNYGGEVLGDFSELRQIVKDNIDKDKEFIKNIFGELYVDGDKILIPCKEPRFFIRYESRNNHSQNISILESVLYPFHKYDETDIDSFERNKLGNNTLPILYRNLFHNHMDDNYAYKNFTSYRKEQIENLVYSIIEPEYFIINPNPIIADKILKGSVFELSFNDINDDIYEKLKEFKLFLGSIKDYGCSDDISNNLEQYYDDLLNLCSEFKSHKADRIFVNLEKIINEYKEVITVNQEAINNPEKFLDRNRENSLSYNPK